jgi:hypothetical protein
METSADLFPVHTFDHTPLPNDAGHGIDWVATGVVLRTSGSEGDSAWASSCIKQLNATSTNVSLTVEL